jgi:Flp pilus assembly protein TadG
MRQRRRNDKRRRTGAALVEAALVLPLVLLFILGVMEYGRYLMTMHIFQNAAREGAAYAAKHTSPIVIAGMVYGNSTEDVASVVSSRLAGQQLINQKVSVYRSDSVGNNLGTWTDARAGQFVSVEITGTYQFAAPTLLSLPSSMSTTFKAVKRSEGN